MLTEAPGSAIVALASRRPEAGIHAGGEREGKQKADMRSERLLHAVHRQAGDLMVVVNVGDSRVVLGTAFDDDAITSSSSSST
uniref:Uncharacterized protein n=1 Tax=Zea mays TaxID=4577 RepID=A0A804LLS8_MAIZE